MGNLTKIHARKIKRNKLKEIIAAVALVDIFIISFIALLNLFIFILN